MIFLIEYDRTEGRILSLTHFADSQRDEADDARLRLELNLNQRGIEREIVLLQATTEEALRRTHRRYFEDLHELTTVPST